MTIFFSSHILSEVQRICDRVAIIRRGKIVKVETIENLKKNLLKRVILTFKNSVFDEIDLKGMVNPSIDGQHLSFMFDGDINSLLIFLSQYDLENVSIEEPTLDEIFLHFYKNHGDDYVN